MGLDLGRTSTCSRKTTLEETVGLSPCSLLSENPHSVSQSLRMALHCSGQRGRHSAGMLSFDHPHGREGNGLHQGILPSHLDADRIGGYSRRFATATARTASLGSHSRGMIQGRSGKWSGGVEARRALLSDGLPSHEGSPVVTMGVFNTKSWSNGRFGANIAP